MKTVDCVLYGNLPSQSPNLIGQSPLLISTVIFILGQHEFMFAFVFKGPPLYMCVCSFVSSCIVILQHIDYNYRDKSGCLCA